MPGTKPSRRCDDQQNCSILENTSLVAGARRLLGSGRLKAIPIGAAVAVHALPAANSGTDME
jgi:hypothetical protein